MRTALASALGRAGAALDSARGRVGDATRSLASMSARRPRTVLAVAAALCVVAALLVALRLDADAEGPVPGAGGDARQATDRFERQFGDDPVTVLIKGRQSTTLCEPRCRLTDLLLTDDLTRVLGLEGCLSGNVPRGGRPLAPACAELARSKPIQVVYGPGTFINESARQVANRFDAQRARSRRQARRAARAARKVAAAQGLGEAEQDRLAREARRLVDAQLARDALQLALRYGLSSAPSIDNPEFVLRLVFEPSLGATTPKPRFAYLFPSQDSALIQARLRPGLDADERREAIGLVREAVASSPFSLSRATYSVAGAPVVEEAVESRIDSALALTSVCALILIGGLFLLARPRGRRLPPLASGVVAALLTLGLLAAVGGSLTLATVALPAVVLGLVCAQALLAAGGRTRDDTTPSAPPVAVVALATVTAGLLALTLSPVSMVRVFGALAALGVLLGFVARITVGVALVRWTPSGAGAVRGRLARLRARLSRPAARAGAAGARVGRMGRGLASRPAAGARSLVATLRRGSLSRRAAAALRQIGATVRSDAATVRRVTFSLPRMSLRHPVWVLVLAVAIAVTGWALDRDTAAVATLERLGPAGLGEVEDARSLRRETGSLGELSVVVRSPRLTSPPVVRWMRRYEQEALQANGFDPERSCSSANLCPGRSFADLLGAEGARSDRRANAVLDDLPAYFASGVVARDRRTAIMTFSVRDMPLAEADELLDDLRRRLDPPRGTKAELAGPPVVAAEAGADVRSGHLLMALAAIAAVALVLPLAFGRAALAFSALVALAIASGWSALALVLLPLPLNPLSATLTAIATVLAAGPASAAAVAFRNQRPASAPAAALDRAWSGAGGRRVWLYGLAALAGLVALVASDLRILRETAVAALVSLPVTFAVMVVVLPAALVLSERARALSLPRSRAEAAELGRAIAAAIARAALAAGRAARTGTVAGRRAAGAAFRGARSRARGLRRPRGPRPGEAGGP